MDRESRSMAYTMETDIGLAVAYAEGCRIRDESGVEYLDMTAGSGVHALGHRHPAVLAAIREQLDAFVHGGWQFTCPARAALTEALLPLLPWRDPVLLFCVTGSEAVEASLKVARAATGRREVTGFLGGYHGKTAGSLAVTAQSRYRVGVSDLPLASLRLPYPATSGYLAPCAALRDGHAFGQDILDHPDFGTNSLAAIVMETVQGSGGMLAAAPGFLTELRKFTARHGILLVLDEIFTGFGRTGAMFGFQHEDVVPDLVVLGKALGGGLPVALVAGPRELMAAIGPLQQTSTFSANPVACAAGVAVLRAITEGDLPAAATRAGADLAAALGAPQVSGVRLEVGGRGLMLGARIAEAPDGDPQAYAARTVQYLRRRGVLALRGGPGGDVVKMTPPLIIADAEIRRVGAAFEQALRDAANG